MIDFKSDAQRQLKANATGTINTATVTSRLFLVFKDIYIQ